MYHENRDVHNDSERKVEVDETYHDNRECIMIVMEKFK